MPSGEAFTHDDIRAAARIVVELLECTPTRSMSARTIADQAQEFDIPAGLLHRVKDEVGIRSVKEQGYGGGWLWTLPPNVSSRDFPTAREVQSRRKPMEPPKFVQAPCFRCEKMTRTPAPYKDSEGGITNPTALCDECRAKAFRAAQENYRRTIRARFQTLNHITRDGFSPGDPQEVALRKGIAAAARRMYQDFCEFHGTETPAEFSTAWHGEKGLRTFARAEFPEAVVEIVMNPADLGKRPAYL